MTISSIVRLISASYGRGSTTQEATASRPAPANGRLPVAAIDIANTYLRSWRLLTCKVLSKAVVLSPDAMAHFPESASRADATLLNILAWMKVSRLLATLATLRLAQHITMSLARPLVFTGDCQVPTA